MNESTGEEESFIYRFHSSLSTSFFRCFVAFLYWFVLQCMRGLRWIGERSFVSWQTVWRVSSKWNRLETVSEPRRHVIFYYCGTVQRWYKHSFNSFTREENCCFHVSNFLGGFPRVLDHILHFCDLQGTRNDSETASKWLKATPFL